MITLPKSGSRFKHPLFYSILALLFSLSTPNYVTAAASCSLTYNPQADLTQDIPSQATDADFMELAWNHFLALNAPSVEGKNQCCR